MIRDGRQTCVDCGTRFAPTRPYRGEYCPACQRPRPTTRTMARKVKCEWGDCGRVATHKVTYSGPSEIVYYCSDCMPAVRQSCEYEHVMPL